MHRSHHVHCISFHWLSVGVTYQGLCGQVENDFRACYLHGFPQFIGITDIGDFAARHAGADFCGREKIRLGRRVERVAMHFCAHGLQP